MCVCIYIYIYIYAHTHTHTYTNTYIHTYIRLGAWWVPIRGRFRRMRAMSCMHAYIHTYIHTYIHMLRCVTSADQRKVQAYARHFRIVWGRLVWKCRQYVYLEARGLAWLWTGTNHCSHACVHVRMYVCMCMYIYIFGSEGAGLAVNRYKYTVTVHVCMYVCMYEWIDVLCIHACTPCYVCMYVCMHVFTHVLSHVYMYVSTARIWNCWYACCMKRMATYIHTYMHTYVHIHKRKWPRLAKTDKQNPSTQQLHMCRCIYMRVCAHEHGIGVSLADKQKPSMCESVFS
jgi:hypothetical protein